jgi:hypothetical protein
VAPRRRRRGGGPTGGWEETSATTGAEPAPGRTRGLTRFQLLQAAVDIQVKFLLPALHVLQLVVLTSIRRQLLDIALQLLELVQQVDQPRPSSWRSMRSSRSWSTDYSE